MVRSKLAMGFVVGLFWIAVSVPSGAVAADDAAPPGLDNTACLSCHDGEHGDLEVPAADDETRTLTPVEPGAFANSVHADMDCVECHREITDAVADHHKADGVAPPDCVTLQIGSASGRARAWQSVSISLVA